MLERIRIENRTFLTNISARASRRHGTVWLLARFGEHFSSRLKENFSAHALEARDRLAARPNGPYTKLRVLQSWEEEIANDELRSALAFQASGDLGEFESNYLGSWKFKLKFRTLGLGLLRM